MRATGARFRRGMVAAAIATIGLLPASSDAAALLSGSFSGTAIDSQAFVPPFGDFDGSPLTGTFSFDLSGCGDSPVPGPVEGGCLASVTSFLNAVVPVQTTGYGQPETLVQVFNTVSSQRLSIVFSYTNPYDRADLELVGGANAFVTGSDFTSLHAGKVDLARSTLTLMGGRSYRTGVALDSLSFDQAVAGVPDAPSWALLLAGFALTNLALRRRERITAAGQPNDA